MVFTGFSIDGNGAHPHDLPRVPFEKTGDRETLTRSLNIFAGRRAFSRCISPAHLVFRAASARVKLTSHARESAMPTSN
jgi:hypothetical protein